MSSCTNIEVKVKVLSRLGHYGVGGCRFSVYDKYANLQVYLPFLLPRKRAARMETTGGENQPTAIEMESVEEKEAGVDPNM